MSYSWRPLQARPWQALLEASCFAIFCWLGLLLVHAYLSFVREMLLSLLVGIIAGLLCAVRLRPISGSWRRQGISHLQIAVLLGLSLSSLEFLGALLLLHLSLESVLNF